MREALDRLSIKGNLPELNHDHGTSPQRSTPDSRPHKETHHGQTPTTQALRNNRRWSCSNDWIVHSAELCAIWAIWAISECSRPVSLPKASNLGRTVHPNAGRLLFLGVRHTAAGFVFQRVVGAAYPSAVVSQRSSRWFAEKLRSISLPQQANV
jgi:hypothetical protein